MAGVPKAEDLEIDLLRSRGPRPNDVGPELDATQRHQKPAMYRCQSQNTDILAMSS